MAAAGGACGDMLTADSQLQARSHSSRASASGQMAGVMAADGGACGDMLAADVQAEVDALLSSADDPARCADPELIQEVALMLGLGVLNLAGPNPGGGSPIAAPSYPLPGLLVQPEFEPSPPQAESCGRGSVRARGRIWRMPWRLWLRHCWLRALRRLLALLEPHLPLPPLSLPPLPMPRMPHLPLPPLSLPPLPMPRMPSCPCSR